MPKVKIIEGNPEYTALFKVYGWDFAQTIDEADLVLFTGGSDVSPAMYGEKKHPQTYPFPGRDAFEAAIFAVCQQKRKPMAGICRGGQFLNVMSGGSMWQDVDGHAIHGTHEAHDKVLDCVVAVSSTHHQMMKPSLKGDVLMTAKRAHRKERMGMTGIITAYDDEPDVEAVYYDESRSLCYQPHPEHTSPGLKACRTMFFYYIENFFGLKGGKELCAD